MPEICKLFLVKKKTNFVNIHKKSILQTLRVFEIAGKKSRTGQQVSTKTICNNGQIYVHTHINK